MAYTPISNITSDTTFYIDPVLGLDTNDGKASNNAWKTWDHMERMLNNCFVDDCVVTVRVLNSIREQSTINSDYNLITPAYHKSVEGVISIEGDTRKLAGISFCHKGVFGTPLSTTVNGSNPILSYPGANQIQIDMVGGSTNLAPKLVTDGWVAGDNCIVTIGTTAYIGKIASVTDAGLVTFETGKWRSYLTITDKGDWSAAGGGVPAGTTAGWLYTVSVAGTIDPAARPVVAGDRVVYSTVTGQYEIYGRNDCLGIAIADPDISTIATEGYSIKFVPNISLILYGATESLLGYVTSCAISGFAYEVRTGTVASGTSTPTAIYGRTLFNLNSDYYNFSNTMLLCRSNGRGIICSSVSSGTFRVVHLSCLLTGSFGGLYVYTPCGFVYYSNISLFIGGSTSSIIDNNRGTTTLYSAQNSLLYINVYSDGLKNGIACSGVCYLFTIHVVNASYAISSYGNIPSLIRLYGIRVSNCKKGLFLSSSSQISSIGGLLYPYEFNNCGGSLTCTFTAATSLVTATANGLIAGDRVRFTNSGGALPTGISEGVNYYIRDVTTNSFSLSLSWNGAVVTFVGAGTGTHTVHFGGGIVVNTGAVLDLSKCFSYKGVCTFEASNTITATAHGMYNGLKIRFTNVGGAIPVELSLDTDYYLIVKATNTFKISLTPNGSEVAFTAGGTGTAYWNRFLQITVPNNGVGVIADNMSNIILPDGVRIDAISPAGDTTGILCGGMSKVNAEGVVFDTDITVAVEPEVYDSTGNNDSTVITSTKYNTRTLIASGAQVRGDNVILLDGTAAPVALTLLAANVTPRKPITIKCINLTNACSIVGTIDGVAGYDFTRVMTSITIQSDGTNWYIL